jgi:hypothetical protein
MDDVEHFAEFILDPSGFCNWTKKKNDNVIGYILLFEMRIDKLLVE